MRLGTILLQTRAWPDLAEAFRDVEECGYDVAYVADHLTHPTMPGQWLADGWSLLAAAGGVTARVDLGTLVTSAAYHHPVPLARVSATVADVLGGDRLVLGLGAGTDHCALADRGERPTPGAMARRYADLVAGLVAVWSGAKEWTGEDLAFGGVETLPLPPGARPPYLMLAAHGPRSIDLVGRYADGWSSYGGPAATALPREEFFAHVARQSSEVTEACERHDRDPARLRRSLLLGYGTVRPLESVEAYVDAVGRAAGAGFDEVVVYWPDGQRGDRFWSDPQVHADAVRAVQGEPLRQA